MAALHTPICDFNLPAVQFQLPDTEGKIWTLNDVQGEKGLLVMFICNHCPYVKAILTDLVEDTRKLKALGINSVAIMSNDILDYPEDSPENMAKLAKTQHFSFPYLYDETQQVARAYGAVCTPDFFGYNKDLKLQYRGCFDNRQKMNTPIESAQHDLFNAMELIAKTGQGPEDQVASIGCSIKWR